MFYSCYHRVTGRAAPAENLAMGAAAVSEILEA